MDNILVFGTGTVGDYIIKKIDFQKVHVLAFVSEDDKMSIFNGFKVVGIDEICSFDYDYILVATGYNEKVTDLLCSKDVEKEKIVSFIYDEEQTYIEFANCIAEYANKKYNRNKLLEWKYDNTDIANIYPAVFWNGDVSIDILKKDFVREQTLKIISAIIDQNKIDGYILEMGVYKGDFTVVIDRCFKNRKLILYDSFEGFKEDDVNRDSTVDNKVGETSKFKDTSVEYVLNRLDRDTQVIVKKGYFPETFDKDLAPVAFVSIDFNLYEPVKCALELIYPLVNSGGYIMISDYNAPFYSGTKKAVDEWCSKYNKSVVPMADFYGSVLIVKD